VKRPCLPTYPILAEVGFPYETKEVLARIKAMHQNIEPPALAALDMALWTLETKMKNTTIGQLLGINEKDKPIRTYTISVCDKIEMAERIAYGKECGFDTFKLKLNGIDDRKILEDFRALSAVPFAVDANQSWRDIDHAKVFSNELERQGCLLIEQPFQKDDLILTKQLSSSLSIPIMADEAIQTYEDIAKANGIFSGINVKLQKCGGITPAYEMIKHSKSLGLKVLIGCMSESIIGCSAGEVLSPLCDWNDLDGNYLVKEVPFSN
jgi:L-alanine-DL-glutamate epimerase-like enolase superfamily enzyme